jgi:hypothetical protein
MSRGEAVVSELYAIVVEKGLSAGSSGGATIRHHGPFDRATGLVLLARVAEGLEPAIYTPYKKGTMMRVSEIEYLDVSSPRLGEPSQTRITLAQVVAVRSR